MADTTSSPRQVDDIMAPPRADSSKSMFSMPQTPTKSRRKPSRKLVKRIIIWVLKLLPLIAVAVALLVIYRMHQPSPVSRQHITPVTPKTTVTTPATTTPATTTTTKKS